MPNASRSARCRLFGALASCALAAAACGPSLTSLARATFFAGYDCPKDQITVTGGGSDTPYEARGCGKHALYRCRSQNGGMGCEELTPAAAGSAPASSASAAAPAAAPPSPSAAPTASL